MPNLKNKPTKAYLGDGVYAEWTGCDIALFTSNGISESTPICFEEEVFYNFVEYGKKYFKGVENE